MNPEWVAKSVFFLSRDQVQKIINEVFASLRMDAETHCNSAATKRSFNPEDFSSLLLVCQRLNMLAYGGHRLYDCQQPLLELAGLPEPPAPLSATIRERLGEDKCESIRLLLSR